MAPNPDQEEVTVVYIDGMAFYHKQAPPQSSSNEDPDGDYYNIPSVTTTTCYVEEPSEAAITAAYLINSFYDSDAHMEIIYTISQFDNLKDAAIAASSLKAAASVLSAEGYPPNAMASQFGIYNTIAPTASQQYKPAVTSDPATSNTASAASQTPDPDYGSQDHHHGPPVGAIVVGVLVPLVVILAILITSLCCIRHYKRKARLAEEAQGGEEQMGDVGRGGMGRTQQPAIDVRALVATPGMASTSTSPSAPSPASASAQDPPIILSNIISDNYYTGIDTSDHVSLSDSRPAQHHDAETYGEEPPPPYRPRSVPPISRDNSVRTSASVPPRIPIPLQDRPLEQGPEPSAGFAAKDLRRSIGERSLRDASSSGSVRSSHEPIRSSSIRESHMPISEDILRRSGEVRSPFDDPEDEEEEEDDTTSAVSTLRHDDGSDLEYQESIEPTRGHSSL